MCGSGHGRQRVFLVCLLALGAALSSCISSLEPEIEFSKTLEEDTSYYDVYEKYSHRFEIIKDFETRYIIRSTRLSSEFLQAFTDRYKSLYNEPQLLLEEAAGKAGFFVVVYAANRKFLNLADDRLWNVQLKLGGKLAKPDMIKKLKLKERWEPFFKGVTPWTSEYLLVFDEELPKTDTEKALLKEKISLLILSSPDARVVVDL